MKCINRNHPDFQRLLKQTKLPPLLVEAKISLWMEQNKLERFPSDFEFEALIATKNNPIRDLGIKYNMNTAGYMPKNVDLAQVQRDARKLGLKVVKARSGNWYLKDGNRMINPFRQYQLDTAESTDLPIKELSDKLYKWAEVHGIKVEAMEEMVDRFSNNQDLYSGAVAMADFLNKIIVLNKDKENITTLAEEVAHFATAILSESASVKKAQEKVIETDTYKKVKEDYKDIYESEEDFRKEAVDKLLAEAIVEQFKETENNKGILAYLKGIFSKFQKWISGVSTSAKDEIKDNLYPLAQSILTGDYLGQVESIDTSQPVFSQTTYYQLSPEKILEKPIKELDKHLLTFLKQFGVDSKKFESLKEKLGVDALGATDIINKLIWYTKDRNIETVPEEAGHMIVALMGENNDTIKNLLKEITAWEEYETIKEQYLPIYKNEKQVKIEAIGKLIAKALVKNYKAVGLNKSKIQKAIEAVLKFLKEFFNNTGLYNPNHYSSKLADKIALNVLAGNAEFIGNLEPASELLDYNKAIQNNPHAKDIIDTFINLGFPLVGSLAIAAQGEPIYRPNNEPIHDLDFRVLATDRSAIIKLGRALEDYNAVPVHGGWKHTNYTTVAYYIPAKGYSVKVTQRKNGWASRIEVRDSKGRAVTPTAQNVIATDFFIYTKPIEIKNDKGFLNWNDIYKGKLSLSPLEEGERLFQRPKDQKDYLLLKPVQRNTKPDPAFVYYQLNQSKEENKSEKEDSLTKAEKRKQKFVEDSINLLKTRKKWLSTKKPESSKKVLEVINKTILELEKSLRLLELDEGMNSLLELVNSELDAIESQLKKASKRRKINASTSDLIRRFNEMYIDHFGALGESLIYYGFPEDQIEKYREVLNNMTNRINSLDRTNNDLSKGIAEELGVSPDLYEDTKEDLSWWRFYAGNLKYATSDLVKKALKLVKDNIMATKRLAVGVANDLLQAQTVLEANGHKIEEIISSTKDENGKVIYSQYFVDKYDWKSYYEKKSEALQDIAKTLGYESYDQINPMSLTEDQKKIRNKALKLFDEKYSKKIFDAATLTYKRIPKKLDPQYDKIMNENHPEFSASLKAYYLKVMRYNREAVNKLPKSYRTEAAYRMLPGIRKQFLERFFQSDNSFLQNIKESLKESLLIDEDDTQFGMKMEDINAMNNKMVPIFFTNRIPLSNLSLDITRSMTVFSEMAENFQRMNKISGQLETLLYWTGERKYIKNRQKTDGHQSYEYRTLDLILNAHVYGIKKDDVRVNIFGKEISVTKLNQKIAKYISTNNLALNPITSTSGAVKGAIDSTIEDQIGLYTTVESKNFGRVEFANQAMKASTEMFSKKQTSKIQLLLQLTNIVDLNKIVRSSNSSALAREIMNRDLLFVNYRLADFGLKGRAMIAIMDNHRLYNGKFISKYNFIKAKEAEGLEYTNPKTKKKGAGKDAKQVDKEWKDLREKSLYSAYEVVENQLTVKEEFKEYVNDETLNKVTGIIEHVTHKIDGTLSDTDKGQLARTAYGDFVLMHRGWFINLIDSRFMPETKLDQTGEYEMGAYRAFGKYIWENLLQEGKLLSFRAAFRELSPHQQRGIKTTILDLIYLNIVAFVAALANVAGDENEEDWTTQYFAFQMNRILLEQKSGWSPKELLQLIDEPVVGVTTLKDLVNIFDAFSPEVYESGIYEGSTHASKWWWKRLPFKNITELKHPDLKNRFIKQVVDSPTYNMLMKDEDKIRKMSYSDRMSSFFIYQEDILSNQEILDRLDTFEEFEDGNLP